MELDFGLGKEAPQCLEAAAAVQEAEVNSFSLEAVASQVLRPQVMEEVEQHGRMPCGLQPLHDPKHGQALSGAQKAP